MPPSARKLPLLSDKKPVPKSPAPNDKIDAPMDSAPISMDDLLLKFTKLLDDKFADHTKNLDKDFDSKVHERVDSAFQLLKIDHDSKLEDAINVTASKIAESVTNEINILHFELNSTMEVNLPAADSAAS